MSTSNVDSPRLKKTKSKKPEIVRVIADYKATGEAQIDLEKGQLIQVRKKADSGWWEGEVQVKGKKRQIGWFPASYVKPLAMPTSGGSSARSTPDSAVKDPDTKKVRALYAYQAQQSDELNFEPGEVIKILSEDDPTWWKGESESTGRSGLFPSNYVELIKGEKRCKSSAYFVQNEHHFGHLPSQVDEDQMTYIEDDNSSFYSEDNYSDSDDQDEQEDTRKIPIVETLDVMDKSDKIARLVADQEFQRQLIDQLLQYQQKRMTEKKVNLNSRSHTKQLAKQNMETSMLTSNDKINLSINQDTENETGRKKSIREFVRSESQYVASLQRIWTFFELPIRNAALISIEDQNAIFMNCNQLLEMQKEFLHQLSNRCNQSVSVNTIADLLCEHFRRPDVFQAYTSFCTGQSHAMRLLQHHIRQNHHFQKFIRKCDCRLSEHLARESSLAVKCSALPLDSYFLQPMQRITRYPLLINAILKHTSPEHGDKQQLEQALQYAERLCFLVNESCRSAESEERLKWMQKHIECTGIEFRLQFNSQTRLMGKRQLLQAGTLFKVNTGRKLFVFLLNDILLLTTCKSSVGRPIDLFLSERARSANYRLYRRPYSLNELKIVSTADSPSDPASSAGVFAPNTQQVFVLGIRSSRRVFLLRAPTVSDTKKWVKNIQKAITEAETVDQLTKNREDQTAPLLQNLDANCSMAGELHLTLFEMRRLCSSNFVLSMFCVLSVGVGIDQSLHEQTTRTKCVRGNADHVTAVKNPSPPPLQKRFSWGQLETFASASNHPKSGSTQNNWRRQGSLLFKKNPKSYQEISSSVQELNSLASFTARLNFISSYLLPSDFDFQHFHFIISCFEISPYSPDRKLAEVIVPVAQLLKHPDISTSGQRLCLPVQLVDPLASQKLKPEIEIKVLFKQIQK